MAGTIDGRTELRLHLPPDAFVDLEHAREAIHRAESALAQGQLAPRLGRQLGANVHRPPRLPAR
jgi:hypothetical protein